MTTDAPVDQPFTGQTRELNRLVRVQPGTVLVVFPPGERPKVRHPGETVLPTWNPFQYAALALPVTTGVVPLTMTISDLTTLDNQPVEQVTLKILVQLTDAEGFAAVADLAAEFGDTFGAYLMQELQSKIESSVRGAFRMNRLPDLRRHTVAAVLQDRWIPLSFANGTLVRRGLTVTDVGWPAAAETPARGSDRPSRARPAQPQPTAAPVLPATGQLELSLDARLRRVWWSGSMAPLVGIAGAVVHADAAVVAVCSQRPEDHEMSRLRGAFTELYGERTTCLVVSDAGDYESLVGSWLEQVDDDNVVLRSVESLRDGDLLRITLDRPLASPEQAHIGRPSLNGSEVEALRRLLPHRHIEFVSD
ncbi:MAG TPA: hypothetical protein VEX66_07255 [Microlunatus sp.]|nr:hypothetical protein [Microlunatus sp.]